MALTRFGAGNAGGVLPDSIDWTELKALAERHGLSAIVLEGIERLPEKQRPPQEFLLEWNREVMHRYESCYDKFCKAISELAALYNRHGFKMMALQDFVCSLDWPNPAHRPCGDIDIWLFGKQKEADDTLVSENEITLKTSEHNHTEFFWRDFIVENHYDFINVHHHRSNVKIERILKELGQIDHYTVDLYGQRIYLPSPNLHALFLLKQMMMQFAAEGIVLQQLLDWGFYAKAHSKDIDWDWLKGVLKQYGMIKMFNTFNAICVEDFGFPASIFPSVQFNPYIKDRVLTEIICPKFGSDLPKCIVTRFIFKIRRWKANEWKHRLCYKESMWSAFWSGFKSHLMKPSTI